MAMQTGMGLSKILVLAGAGYTGTILIKNGKLSDLIGEIQALVKGLEKSGDNTNSSEADPIATQVQWLAQEIRQLASSRQITVLNGSSGRTDVTSLIVPAAALGAVGYGYMWWKGFSFSDLMYVTKRNMTAAVENLTKHLDTVTETLDKTKKHLIQRIQNLDGKVDEQREMSKLIQDEVHGARGDINLIDKELSVIRDSIYNLGDQIDSFDAKQTLTMKGVMHLCCYVDRHIQKMPELSGLLEEQLKVSSKSRGLLPSSDRRGLQSLLGFGEESRASSREARSISDVDSKGLAIKKLDEVICS